MEENFEDAFAAELDAVPDESFDASQFVPGVGPPDARIVFVGEAPGKDEVERGEPFVGNAGRILDEVLASAGIGRESVYVTNLLKVRPPENRDPRREEIDAWWPVLRAELDRIDPDVVVTLGAFATREVLDTDGALGDLRGETYEQDGFVVVPTYHPAATFYDDDVRDVLERDMARVADLAGE